MAECQLVTHMEKDGAEARVAFSLALLENPEEVRGQVADNDKALGGFEVRVNQDTEKLSIATSPRGI